MDVWSFCLDWRSLRAMYLRHASFVETESLSRESQSDEFGGGHLCIGGIISTCVVPHVVCELLNVSVFD